MLNSQASKSKNIAENNIDMITQKHERLKEKYDSLKRRKESSGNLENDSPQKRMTIQPINVKRTDWEEDQDKGSEKDEDDDLPPIYTADGLKGRIKKALLQKLQAY